MKNVLILGAGGQIARWAIDMLAGEPDIALTLFARRAASLENVPANAKAVEGDVLDPTLLDRAMAGQNVVYANLAGDVDAQVVNIVRSMEAAGVKRLIFVASLGIYDEVPGKFGAWNRREIGSMLPPYRRAADVIEVSGLDYTVIRPAWLTDADEIDYETTEKGQAFKGTEVSRKSVAALIVELIRSPELSVGGSIGVNKPDTDGDKPAFM